MPLPAGTQGDPAVVHSLVPQGGNPTGTGEPVGDFSHIAGEGRRRPDTSALTWRTKTVTMGMEVLRRLRNTTRQATLETRLSRFVSKLRASGYARETISGILKSGITCWSG